MKKYISIGVLFIWFLLLSWYQIFMVLMIDSIVWTDIPLEQIKNSKIMQISIINTLIFTILLLIILKLFKKKR